MYLYRAIDSVGDTVEYAAIILSGIEMIHMMRKRQAKFAYKPSPSIAEQFEILAVCRTVRPKRFTASFPRLRQNHRMWCMMRR